MKIKCLIIDDEPIACKGMQEYVSQVEFLELVGVYDEPLQAHKRISEGEIKLVFLDIEIPGLTGIELAKSLKDPPYIIFTTAYPNYALEGFELGVVDYLLKPIAFARFLKACVKAKELIFAQQENKPALVEDADSFFVKENGRFTRVFYHEILFAEALQNYVAIYLPGRKIISYITLSMLEKQFPENIFMKVHKSYIVSLAKISAIEGNMLKIGSSEIPVSRNTKDELMRRVVENKFLKR